MTARLSRLYIYPIKSAAGIACDTAKLGPFGLQHDREWMIVDAHGRGITQREEARLALLQVAIDAEQLSLSNPFGSGPRLKLTHIGTSVEVHVWGAMCLAFDAGDEVAQFLSDWLGRALRLVRFDTTRHRLANQDWTAGQDVPTLFTDGFPMLVLSFATIADLAARVGRELPIERFRPNLVLEGVAPYAEDSAATLHTDGATLQLTKACTRCVITTIDHVRGERTDDEPLRTLRSYRYDAALRGVVLGRNAYTLSGEGVMLRTGTEVELQPHTPL
jgi:uncharacterized protein